MHASLAQACGRKEIDKHRCKYPKKYCQQLLFKIDILLLIKLQKKYFFKICSFDNNTFILRKKIRITHSGKCPLLAWVSLFTFKFLYYV